MELTLWGKRILFFSMFIDGCAVTVGQRTETPWLFFDVETGKEYIICYLPPLDASENEECSEYHRMRKKAVEDDYMGLWDIYEQQPFDVTFEDSNGGTREAKMTVSIAWIASDLVEVRSQIHAHCSIHSHQPYRCCTISIDEIWKTFEEHDLRNIKNLEKLYRFGPAPSQVEYFV